MCRGAQRVHAETLRRGASPAVELQRDWRLATGQGLAASMGEHLPFYGMLAANLKAANGG